MQVLRTPDHCFEGLSGFEFAPHYAEIPDPDGGTLRVHYLDEGPAQGQIVLLLHGEPSWCYLYRHMVPVLADAGLRVVAPDLVGFGRSDKPTPRSEYTYARHVEWMRTLLFDHLELSDVNLVCQDWGGLIGLRLVAEHSGRFDRVVAANTYLPTGDGTPSEAFLGWLKFSQEVETFPTGTIVNLGCVTDLSPEVIAAYDAPFPEQSYAEGARQFPTLVPISPEDPASSANRAAWNVLEALDKPFLTAFSDGDPITAGSDRHLQARIPGAQGQHHVTISGGGHFLQEDKGDELARVVVDFVRTT
jgi:haloalkane dehalogenase